MIRKPSFYRIDEQVFFTMGVLCLLAMLVLAFRFSTKETCAPVKIITADSLTVGETIVFKAETEGGSKYSWSFGDNSGKDEITNTTTHVYTTPGMYTVSVEVNNSCEETRQVTVMPAAIVENTNFLPIIEAPDTALVGQKITVADNSTTSTSWEWNFGESESSAVDDKEQVATYIYKTEGVKRIRLRVNGRPDLVRYREIWVKDIEAEKKRKKKAEVPEVKPITTIVVIPQEPKSEPIKATVDKPIEQPKQKAPALVKAKLENMLAGIPSGETKLEDFDVYTCGNHNIKVLYDKKSYTLSAFFNELKGMKRKKIKKVSAIQIVNEDTNCIIQISVDIDKRWLAL